MRLHESLRRKPILLGFVVFTAGTTASSLVMWLLQGEFEISNWGFSAAVAVLVAMQARDVDNPSL
jgi:hypothetical protein